MSHMSYLAITVHVKRDRSINARLCMSNMKWNSGSSLHWLEFQTCLSLEAVLEAALAPQQEVEAWRLQLRFHSTNSVSRPGCTKPVPWTGMECHWSNQSQHSSQMSGLPILGSRWFQTMRHYWHFESRPHSAWRIRHNHSNCHAPTTQSGY